MTPEDQELVRLLVKHERASPCPPAMRRDLVPLTIHESVVCCLLLVPIMYWRQGSTYAFGRDAQYSDVLKIWDEHSMQVPIDKARLAALLRHPCVTIAVDPPAPARVMVVSFDEAELLVSWNLPITAWGTRLTMTFWTARSNSDAIRTLRELRKADIT